MFPKINTQQRTGAAGTSRAVSPRSASPRIVRAGAAKSPGPVTNTPVGPFVYADQANPPTSGEKQSESLVVQNASQP